MLALNALCNYGERATRLLGWASKKAARFATDGLDFRNAKKNIMCNLLGANVLPTWGFLPEHPAERDALRAGAVAEAESRAARACATCSADTASEGFICCMPAITSAVVKKWVVSSGVAAGLKVCISASI